MCLSFQEGLYCILPPLSCCLVQPIFESGGTKKVWWFFWSSYCRIWSSPHKEVYSHKPSHSILQNKKDWKPWINWKVVETNVSMVLKLFLWVFVRSFIITACPLRRIEWNRSQWLSWNYVSLSDTHCLIFLRGILSVSLDKPRAYTMILESRQDCSGFSLYHNDINIDTTPLVQIKCCWKQGALILKSHYLSVREVKGVRTKTTSLRFSERGVVTPRYSTCTNT